MSQNEEQETDGHFLRRWVSLGDVISLTLSLVALGVTYGQLSTDVRHTNETVESLAVAVRALQERDITPGARALLASSAATDHALQQQINDLREELRTSRAELLTEIRLVGEKLDRHDRR